MEKLLTELFTRYHKEVYAYLYSLCRDVSLSEDLTSEVFLEVVKSIGTFRGEADIQTWMFTIARRRWANYLRRQNRQIQAETLSEFFESGEDALEEKTSRSETIQKIYGILEKETPRTKDIVLMRMDGFSFREIGQKHGISENSARVVYFREKEKIKRILQKEGMLDE